MNIEILLLIILGALTLIAYGIALNSHGPKRLAASYLLATVILIATVWVTVQYVNSGDNRRKMEEFRKLESEKQKAEQQMKSQEVAMQQALRENKERLGMAGKLNVLIARGTTLSAAMMNLNLSDLNQELDVLLGRAADTKKKIEELDADFDKMKMNDTLFTQTGALIKEAIKQLTEAAQYYSLYYRAEDGAQEELRERIMRQKATEAHNLLQKASTLITPSGN
jgi:hypothetical protein